MNKTLYFLIGFLAFNCINETKPSNKSDLNINSIDKKSEIKYKESREKTIENLNEIWNSDVLISKDQINFNGEISNNVSLLISGIENINSEIKKVKILLTKNLIKKSVLNYTEFSELKIIFSYVTSDEERNTSSKYIKMNDL